MQYGKSRKTDSHSKALNGLNPDYQDMLSSLNEAQAEYLLVGAYAVAAHAVSRFTQDIDFWVRPPLENAPRVLKALKIFQAPLDDLTEADIAKPGTIFQIGAAHQCIHLMTSISGVTFDEAWPHRIEIDLPGHRVPVIGLNELIKKKPLPTGPKT